MHNLLTILTASSLALVAHAAITQADFTGIGHIQVLASDDWSTATPNDTVGCLDTYGKFIASNNTDDCGVFSRLDTYPYTLSTAAGNCTFNDESQETNDDSYYGKTDHAWNCNETYESVIYDELYTIDGFSYVFLCFGDIACYYDAKRLPEANEELSLWQFRWGSQQMDITPGHTQMLLMWNKIGELPKRKSASSVPGPRMRIESGMQVPLQGQGARS
ncbi:hypothetical protein P153DRAFT_292137 [Dothidotthia symphoricarpi CBS 119687]|uniref:Ecp2 effector protein domain-containing protein n=1 Tax=Dothidotthia symphoricarpi CBS 119687 TaxID=1392245 RepID=A0A6A6ACB1_9PLEO|nr:uncharacterized protein P153DRAFT_292137 [Dothidotthia symphoricarpi CBS 119687]KAF2128873.1 hypothetical protein P153DRAFT_292137 [Dothidotthia symphoricarpi CBS 119687]